MHRKPMSGSRLSLILLVLLALLPALGLILYNGYEQREAAAQQAKAEAQRVTRLVSEDYNRVVSGTREILTVLSQVEAVKSRDSQVCSQFMANLLPQFEKYTNFGVVDLDGNIFCSGVPLKEKVNIRDRSYFQDTVHNLSFSPGEFQIGRITGKPSVNFAYPILNPDGSLRSVVFAALDLNSLVQLAVDVDLPENTSFTLIDWNGTMLIRYPDPNDWIGKSVLETSIYKAIRSNPEGVYEGLGFDGISRVTGYTHLKLAGNPQSTLVTVSIPTEIAYAAANRTLGINLAIFGGITLLGIATAWVGGYLFLMRRIADLLRVTRQLSAGDYSARSGFAQGGSELGELARSVDELGATLQRREIEAKKSAEDLLRSEQQYRSLIELSPYAIYIHCDGKFVYVNPAGLKLFGAQSPEEILHTSAIERVHPECVEKVSKRIQIILEEQQSVPPIYEKYIRLDGSTVDAEVIASPVTWEGKPASQVIAHDITDIKQAEQAERRRAEEMAALYQTSLDIISQRDLDSLLTSIVERASRLLNVNSGGLYLMLPGNQGLELVATYNVPDRIQGTIIKEGEGICGEVARLGEIVQIENYSQWQNRAGVYDELNFKRAIGTPLKVGNRIIGVISLTDNEKVGSFSNDEIRLVKLFGDQAALAIENTRLYESAQTELAERVRAEQAQKRLLDELTVLHAISVAGNEADTLDDLMAKVTQLMGEKFYTHDFGMALFDEGMGGLRFHPSYRIRSGSVQPLVRPGEGITGWVLQHKIPRLVSDAQNESGYISADPYTRSELCVPILHQEKILGVLNAESDQQNAYSADDERLMVSVAGELGMAIEKLRLLDAERRRSRELGVLSKVSSALRSAQTRNDMGPIILEQMREMLRASGTALVILNRNSDEATVELAQGAWAENNQCKLNLQGNHFGLLITSGKPFQSNQALSDSDLESLEFKNSLEAVIWAPLMAQEQLIGMLGIGRPEATTPEDIRLLTAIADIAASAMHRASLHDQTVQRMQRLTTLRTIDMAITAHNDANFTLNILLEEVVSSLKMDAADILLFNSSTRSIEWGSGRGFRNPALNQGRIALPSLRQRGRNLPLYEAVMERHPVIVSDILLLDYDRGPLLAQEGITTAVLLPFVAKGQVKGVMEVFLRKPDGLDRELMDFLESMASQGAIALDNVELFENLDRSNMELSMAFEATIEGWSRALVLRNEDTEEHCTRVVDKTLQLARCMGILENQMAHLRRGALLHDIGKMAIPDAILLKPGPLNDEEWIQMRKHPEHAYHLLSPIAFLRPAIEIPYNHHEKWDGSGYPRGLKGEEIPLAARIFAIVDVWDALLSDRPYRKAWTEARVKEYLQGESGKHFDPQVVAAFFKLQGW